MKPITPGWVYFKKRLEVAIAAARVDPLWPLFSGQGIILDFASRRH
jgi:hypothetical protein